ncbi:MAG TPA: hypothetical protein VHV49_10040 [Pseudonocardiaceae bacterium]|jgi:hypothetical protein|nr:hypothetical protein [Pseudonocardiaceae bacterium]
MSKNRTPRISRRTAARMLRGAPASVPDALAGLLAAAAAPPRDGELAGEPAATEAFLATRHRTTVPQARSRARMHGTLRTPVVVKLVAAVAAIFTVGGVAAAAATGHLTQPAGGSPASAVGHPAASGSTALTSTSAQDTFPATHPASPSLVGQCRAYAARATGHHRPPGSAAFTALITAAGGTTKVGAYCAELLKATASAAATGSSTANTTTGRSRAGHEAGADHPTGPPTSHPTGPPATHPTGPPATHSSGAPRTHPAGAATVPGKH